MYLVVYKKMPCKCSEFARRFKVLYLITPKVDMITNSARLILVCLEEAKLLDKTSESYDKIARTIAHKYYSNLTARINREKEKQ